MLRTSVLKMSQPTVFDCFCGFGGLSIGAELAGMKVVGGIDASKSAISVFAECFPDATALCNDLLAIKPRKILAEAKIKKGDIDVLVGGPPCQPYSINNHQRGIHDSRCDLVERYLEFVSTLSPNWLVMENVPAFASIERGEFLRTLLRSLRGRGYTAQFGILDATNFGVPQKRRRLIVLACRDRKKVSSAMADLMAQEKKSINIGEALGDLPELPSITANYRGLPVGKFQRLMRQGAHEKLQAHLAPQLGEKNLNRIRHVPPGGNWRDIPRVLLPLAACRTLIFILNKYVYYVDYK